MFVKYLIQHYDAYYSNCVHIILRQLSRGFIGFSTEGIVAFRLTRFINFPKTHAHTNTNEILWIWSEVVMLYNFGSECVRLRVGVCVCSMHTYTHVHTSKSTWSTYDDPLLESIEDSCRSFIMQNDTSNSIHNLLNFNLFIEIYFPPPNIYFFVVIWEIKRRINGI